MTTVKSPGSGNQATVPRPLTVALVRELASAEPEAPVLSVHLRTDPRDPANTNHVPGWLIALRNGLRATTEQVNRVGARAHRLQLRQLVTHVEDEITALAPEDRGRGVSLFAGIDDPGWLLLTHQLAPRDHVVRWDERPFVTPLVDLAARGRATGIVLVGTDAVRLLHWEAGRIREPEDPLYTLELGDWREYAGYAAANPARGQQTATHEEAYEQRVDEWRRRFVRQVAAAAAQRAAALGWQRVLVAGEQPLADGFADALPAHIARRVLARVDANVLWQSPAEIAGRLERPLEDALLGEARSAVSRIVSDLAADGLAAAGHDAVVRALLERRVEHLVVEPVLRSPAGPPSDQIGRALAGSAPDMLGERAIELAVAGGADVTVVAADQAPVIDEVAGIAARLRH